MSESPQNMAERLARLEVLVPELRDDIKELKAEIKTLSVIIAELSRAANMGRGALWIMLPVGTILGWAITNIVTWFRHLS